jgi:Transketolase, N-terminal subunit
MFVKYHTRLSCILSPAESQFMMHMVEISYLAEWGHKTDFTRTQYMKRMGLREHTFDTAAKILLELGLINRSAGSGRNRVFYELNEENWERLQVILSATWNIDKLRAFLDFNLKKLGRPIADITDKELDELHSLG